MSRKKRRRHKEKEREKKGYKEREKNGCKTADSRQRSLQEEDKITESSFNMNLL